MFTQSSKCNDVHIQDFKVYNIHGELSDVILQIYFTTALTYGPVPKISTLENTVHVP